MDSLWAPWRIKYILRDKEQDEDCFLCRKPAANDDAKNYILFRERNCFALLNVYPYNAGHVMVCPYQHTGELEDLSPQVLGELMQLTVRSQQLLQRAMNPDGFNIGLNIGLVAGAGLRDHVHVHVVPRWNGDTNYMPVLGETRVVPQALDELYAALMEHA